MPQYAFFDSTVPAPAPVMGWLDTDLITFTNLPSPSDLLQLTADQWTAHFSGTWAVSDGTLIPYTAPPPVLTLSQQAAAALNAGLTVLSKSQPDFNAIYAVDPTAQGKIGAISTYILVNNKFPGGLLTYPWLDMSGTAHTVSSPAMFQEFATQVADYVATLDVIVATNTGTLPIAEVTIS